ncbi:uncharacterized protein LOC132196992 [Neocloeon triangulifer]|uniref:uncharacterized protein LOC132196992 n=1 Tax=Neocloeon triangulifer TaxID=2078957 RepID=UPI00286F476A|nr:uncharacterized protein LOC132196992 [Neocloeon triangulifer]
MRIRFWMVIGFLTTCLDYSAEDETVSRGSQKSLKEISPSSNVEKLENEELLKSGDQKILFMTTDMEEHLFSGASETINQLTHELGTNLKTFQESVNNPLKLKRHLQNLSVIHAEKLRNFSFVTARIKRQVRKVIRCCGGNSCSYSDRANTPRTGYGNGYGFGNGYGYGLNGYGGYSPWDGTQTDSNVNRGTQGFKSVAVAMVLPHGVSISCPGCAPGWQQNLNFGHGVGFIPITCPGCPKGWQQMLNMGPGVNGGGGNDYEDESSTTPATTTTTVPTTTTELTTTEETTTEEVTTEAETTTEGATTAAAAGGGLGGLLGGLLGR